MEGEVWKDIKGYENLYQVSNLGILQRIGVKEQWIKENVRTVK